MRNIIIIALLLIIPVGAYFLMKDTSDYKAVAKDDNNPTLITFTSTMCNDCKKMKEILKEIEPSYSNRVNFINMNALDNNKEIQNSIKKYNVVLVPTMIFLDRNGETKNKIEGYIPKEELTNELEGLING